MEKTHIANITPRSVQARASDDGFVLVRFDCPDLEIVAPFVELRLRLDPSEAQDVAQLLLAKADEALGSNARYPSN